MVVGVPFRTGDRGSVLFERLGPLSEVDEAKCREGAGDFILDSRIGVCPKFEQLRTRLEREPPCLPIFSGTPSNEAVVHEIGNAGRQAVVLAKLHESFPEFQCIVSVPSAHRQAAEGAGGACPRGAGPGLPPASSPPPL